MKYLRRSIVMLILAAFTLALPVVAQEATPEAADLQTFTTSDGNVSVQFPAGWVSKKGNDSGSILTLKMANRVTALDMNVFGDDGSPKPGDVHIELIVLSLPDFVKDFPAGSLTVNDSPIEIVNNLIEQTASDDTTFSQAGAITINGYAAARVNVIDGDNEGQLMFIKYSEQWVGALVIFAASGEIDKWEIAARNILGSVKLKTTTTATQTYTSTDGGFTVTYPAGWEFDDRSDDTSDDVRGGLFSNSHDAQYKELYEDQFESGDIVIQLVIADLAKLAVIPELKNVNDNTTVIEVLQGFVDARIISSNLEYGEVEATTTGNGTAAQAKLSKDANGDGRILAIKRDDGLYIVLVIYTGVGEIESGVLAARRIASSIVIDDTVVATPVIESTLEPLSLTQSVITKNGVGTVSYPENWLSRQHDDTAVYLGNSEVALAKSFDDAFTTGEANIMLTYSSIAEFAEVAQLPIDPETTAVDLLEETIKAVGEGITFSAVEATSIGDRQSARVDFTSAAFEGTAWVIFDGKDQLITIQLLTAVGEAEQWQQTALDITETAAFTTP